MPATTPPRKVLVMGVGNALLQDDGVGVRVVEALAQRSSEARPATGPEIELVDAGTIGLALLPQLEGAEALIVVDASQLDAPPGSLRVFRGREIEALLSSRRRSVHEVALLDLLAAASLRGRCPARRALVAIQPGCTDGGLEPTPEVAAVIPAACQQVLDLVGEWCMVDPRTENFHPEECRVA